MIRAFFKEQATSAAFALFLFFAVYFVCFFSSLSAQLKNSDTEKNYISAANMNSFAETFGSDSANVKRRFFELIDLKGYDGADAVTLDPASQLAGEHPEYTLEQIEWMIRHESDTESFTGSINADNELFIRMEKTYMPVIGFDEKVKQKISVNKLLIKKERASEYDKIIAGYELSQLENIRQLPDRITALSGVSCILQLFCGDVLFPFLTALLCFDMFAKFKGGGYPEYIKTLKCGAVGFCKGRLISAAIIFAFIYVAYCFSVFAAMLIYSDGTEFLSYPCQVLSMTKECVFSLCIGQFLALTAVMRFLYHAVFFMLFSFISLLSGNSAISAVICFCTAALPAIFSKGAYMTAFEKAVTGDISEYFSGADTVVLLGDAIPLYMLQIIGYTAIIAVLAVATILVGKRIFKTRYKAKSGDVYA